MVSFDDININLQLVMPGEKAEIQEFQEKAVNNTLLLIDFSLPNVNVQLPSKSFLEVLYNRLVCFGNGEPVIVEHDADANSSEVGWSSLRAITVAVINRFHKSSGCSYDLILLFQKLVYYLILLPSSRLNNDLLMWEPLAPIPTDTHEAYSMPSSGWDLNMATQLMHHGTASNTFSMCKSGVQYG